MNPDRIGLIVSARMGSSRLPGKVLKPLNSKPLVLFLLHRLRKSTKIKNIIVATTTLASDDQLCQIVKDAGYTVFRGSEKDLVRRYLAAAKKHGLEILIRVTGDCPFLHGEVIDHCLEQIHYPLNYIASTKRYFPIGIDCEIFSYGDLKKLNVDNLTCEEREHLTLGFYNRVDKFNQLQLKCKYEWLSKKIYTVDVLDDYERAQKIVYGLGSQFSISELINYEKA